MTTPLDELQWKSPEWIQAFGLHTDNVLDYFAESPFFNKTSNNQVIRMQKQFSQIPNGQTQDISKNNEGDRQSGDGEAENSQSNRLHSQIDIFKSSLDDRSQDQEFEYADANRREIIAKYPSQAILERELEKMKGIEYVLAYVREPDFWIINKQNRINQETTRILQTYYIIGANVYQSPTAFNIIQSRLLSASFHISSMLENLHKVTIFEPSQGVQIKTVRDNISTGSTFHPSTGASVNGPSTLPQTAGITAPTTTTTYTSSSTTKLPGPPSLNTINTVAGTSQYDPNSTQRETLTIETMNTLMAMSIKSTPEYI